MYVGASLNQLGIYFFSRGFSRTYFARVPSHLEVPEGSNRIFVLDFYACFLGSIIPRREVAGQKSIIIFCDNNPAIVSLLRGLCPQCPLATRVGRNFWEVMADTSISVWVERVPSAENKADRPSRSRKPQDVEERFPSLGSHADDVPVHK